MSGSGVCANPMYADGSTDPEISMTLMCNIYVYTFSLLHIMRCNLLALCTSPGIQLEKANFFFGGGKNSKLFRQKVVNQKLQNFSFQK